MTKFKPGDLVEVRDHDSQKWQTRTFVAEMDLPCPYLVMSENKGFVISFAQCRHANETEIAKRAKIAELEQKLKQLEQEIEQLKNQ